jgi:hypothetical protein
LELGFVGLGVLSVPHVFFHQDITTLGRQPLAPGESERVIIGRIQDMESTASG